MDGFKFNYSQLIYEKFIDKYNKLAYEYREKQPFIEVLKENNNVIKVSFLKLSKLYISLCLILLIAKFILPYNIFGGFTYKKLLYIYVGLLFIIFVIFILAISNIKNEKDISLATLSILEVFDDEEILESRNNNEIIDFLYENREGIGSFYIKVLNILKDNNLRKYLQWVITSFIGFFIGFISSALTTNFGNDIKNDLHEFLKVSAIGLIYLFLLIIFFSVCYYIAIHFIYKQEILLYELYFISLKNIKLILLSSDDKSKIKSELKKIKEECMSKDLKNKKVNKISLIKNFIILYLIISYMYIFIYLNIDSDLIRKPIFLLLFFLTSSLIYIFLQAENKLLVFTERKINKNRNSNTDLRCNYNSISSFNNKIYFTVIFIFVISSLAVNFNVEFIKNISCFLKDLGNHNSSINYLIRSFIMLLFLIINFRKLIEFCYSKQQLDTI